MDQNHPKHPTNVPEYPGTLQQLAEGVSNLRYDSLAALVGHLADKIKADADRDHQKGRSVLAGKLYQLADQLYKARDQAVDLWEFCRKFMEE